MTRRTPRIFYGWVVLAIGTISFAATGPAQTMIVSQFNTHIQDALKISEVRLAAAYAIATVLASIPLVLVGHASDRFGPRLIMGAAVTGMMIACVAIALADGFLWLMAAFFMLRFFGQGSLALVTGHMMALWFERRLGFAEGLRSVAQLLLWIPLPEFTVVLIDGVGWRGAYPILGVGACALVLPLATFLLVDRPENVGQHIDGDDPNAPAPKRPTRAALQARPAEDSLTLKQALRYGSMWILVGSTVLNVFLGTAVVFSHQPLLREAGLDDRLAARALTGWLWGQAICMIPFGRLADRVPPAPMIAIGLWLLATSLVMLAFANSFAFAFATMLVFGVGMAALVAATGPTLARFFGRGHHGSIRGFMIRAAVAGTGLAPIAIAGTQRATGSYAIFLIIGAAIAIATGFAALRLHPPPKEVASNS